MVGVRRAGLALLHQPRGKVRQRRGAPVGVLLGELPDVQRGGAVGQSTLVTRQPGGVRVLAHLELVAAQVVTGSFGSLGGAIAILGVMIAAATSEELLFRGVLFRVVEGRFGTWISPVGTGVLFGLLHIFNPDATLYGALCIAIEAGFMLAACYAAFRNLWVPIGLHFGWNFAAGGIFSVAATWAEAGLVTAADLLAGDEDPRQGAGSLIERSVATLRSAGLSVRAKVRGPAAAGGSCAGRRR